MQNDRRKIKLSSGMTLVELLIVVSIVIFLVLVAMWYFRNQIFKGNDAKRKGDIHRIQVAVEEYEKDNNCYPLSTLVICSPGDSLKPYISKIPCDPTTKSSYSYEQEDSECPGWYRINATLENENDLDILSCALGNYCASSPNAPDCNLVSSGYYGCKLGVCVPILWNSLRPGPECDPNYSNATCYDQCGPPETECQQWSQ